MDCETSPATTIKATVLKLGTEFGYLSKVLMGVLVLFGFESYVIKTSRGTRLGILPRDFNVVKLSMLEFARCCGHNGTQWRAYMTLLTELGYRRVGATGVRRYAGRGAGAWRSFIIQVNGSSRGRESKLRSYL